MLTKNVDRIVQRTEKRKRSRRHAPQLHSFKEVPGGRLADGGKVIRQEREMRRDQARKAKKRRGEERKDKNSRGNGNGYQDDETLN